MLRMLSAVILACVICGVVVSAGEADPKTIPLKILTEEFPPTSMTQKGKVTGFSVEVVREILKRLGRDDDITPMIWKTAWDAALKENNVVLFSTTWTQEREPLFQWVGPLYTEKWDLYAKKDSPIVIKRLADAKEVGSIGVYKDDARKQVLVAQGFTNLKTTTNAYDNAIQLLAGEIDLWITSHVAMPYIVKKANLKPAEYKSVYTVAKANLYIAFSKKMPANVVAAWQQELDAMKKDGTFKKIHEKWMPADSYPENLPNDREE